MVARELRGFDVDTLHSFAILNCFGLFVEGQHAPRIARGFGVQLAFFIQKELILSN
jgi:hypothetical protein